MACLSILFIVGFVLVGVLLVAGVISMDEVWAAVGRCFVAVVLILLLICIAREFTRLALRAVEIALHCIGIAVITAAGLLVLTMLIAHVVRRGSPSSKGDGYEHYEG